MSTECLWPESELDFDWGRHLPILVLSFGSCHLGCWVRSISSVFRNKEVYQNLGRNESTAICLISRLFNCVRLFFGCFELGIYWFSSQLFKDWYIGYRNKTYIFVWYKKNKFCPFVYLNAIKENYGCYNRFCTNYLIELVPLKVL